MSDLKQIDRKGRKGEGPLQDPAVRRLMREYVKTGDPKVLKALAALLLQNGGKTLFKSLLSKMVLNQDFPTKPTRGSDTAPGLVRRPPPSLAAELADLQITKTSFLLTNPDVRRSLNRGLLEALLRRLPPKEELSIYRDFISSREKLPIRTRRASRFDPVGPAKRSTDRWFGKFKAFTSDLKWLSCSEPSMRGHIAKAHFHGAIIPWYGVARYDIEACAVRGTDMSWVVKVGCHMLERSDAEIEKEMGVLGLKDNLFKFHKIFQHASSADEYREMIVTNLLYIEQLGLAEIPWDRVERAYPGARQVSLDIEADSFGTGSRIGEQIASAVKEGYQGYISLMLGITDGELLRRVRSFYPKIDDPQTIKEKLITYDFMNS